jgi:hypothetical protein
MSQTIDTRVPADLHPDVVRSLDGYGEPVAHLVGETETVLSEAYAQISKVFDAREASKHNPVWNESAQIINTYALAESVEKKLDKKIFHARSTLENGVAALEQELTAPVTAKASDPVASEIRAHAKSLESGERMSFMTDAISNGDQATATALLGAPPYLSGLEPKMQQTFTRMYHERMNPDAARRVKLMTAANQLLADRHSSIGKALQKAVGAPVKKVQALRDAKTAAERHFVLQDS